MDDQSSAPPDQLEREFLHAGTQPRFRYGGAVKGGSKIHFVQIHEKKPYKKFLLDRSRIGRVNPLLRFKRVSACLFFLGGGGGQYSISDNNF